MTMPQPILEAAKAGDPMAIATLLNHSFQVQGITATTRIQKDCLEIMLEADQTPSQAMLVERIQRGLRQLGITSVQRCRLYGKTRQAPFPDWHQEIFLQTPLATVPATHTVPQPLSTMPARVKSAPSSAKLARQKSYWSWVRLPTRNRQATMVMLIVVGMQLTGIGGLVLWDQLQRRPELKKMHRSSITIAAPANPLQPNVGDRGFRAPIKYRQNGIPVIDVVFNDNQTFEMILDTGASGTLITQQMAYALQVEPSGMASLTIADGSQVQLSVGYVRSIAVDGAIVSNIPVVIAPPTMPIGLLGHDFFRDFDIQIKQDVVEFHPR